MNLQLRCYQERIVASIGENNAILKMPTGSGKTIVAAAIVKERLELGSGRAALFLVPKHTLVEQQSQVLKVWCPDAHVLSFHGGLVDPPMEDVLGQQVCIVSTPQAFLNLQKRKIAVFGWHNFEIVVFDEVHHCLKEHHYRHLALRLKSWHESCPNSDQKVQILGLSASLTYNVTEVAVRETLNRLCFELSIEKMESPSAEELEAGGYVPQHGRNVELESSSEVPEGILMPSKRKPHLMHSLFMDRIRDGTATSFSLKVSAVIQKLEDQAAQVDSSFRSPLSNPKLVGWEQHAHDKAILQPWNAQTLNLLESWYIGLRLLVQTWEEEELLVIQWLKMNDAFEGLDSWPEAMEIKTIADSPENFYKLGRLRFHLFEKRQRRGETFKCLVFAQQRITALILSHFINTDPVLQSLGLKSGYVTAQASKITPSIKVTKRMATDTVKRFRSNELNVIVATKVLEEGFDVPSANVVISYDHMKDAVELCQRTGRAREADSSIVILDERPDRPLAILESVRAMQDSIVDAYDPSFVAASEEIERSKQLNREQCALRSVLQKPCLQEKSPLQVINEYVQKTRGSLTDEYTVHVNGFKCTLTYQSLLRSVTVHHDDTSKKGAKQRCALALLSELEIPIAL